MSKKTYAERNLKFETLQLHVGQEQPDPVTDARAVPIYQTSSYVFRNSDHAAARFGLQDPGNIYGRLTNPTEDVFEKRIAALEGGVAALAVASGAAAIAYTIENLAHNGDHIVAANNIYGGTFNLLEHTLTDYGITTTFVDPANFDEIDAAIKDNTKAVFIETLGNPNSDVVDIDAVAEVAHKHKIPLVVDNTFATPYLVRPIEHGADIVVHSATKFIGGHGTTIGGVIVGDNIDVDENGVISVTLPEPYTLPVATNDTLGGVKIGDGVNVDQDGTISVTQYQSGVATEIISGESVDIPDIYQRVEYIQSDTTQYIDTGYTQRSGSCFRIEVCPLQDPNLQSAQQVIFGNYVTTYRTQSYQVCWYMNDQNIYQFTFGISNTRYPAYTYFTGYYDQDIVAHVYNDTIEIYDSNDEYLLVKKTLNQSIGNGANTIAIFCKHVDDHYDSKSKIKLRRFSIYSQLNSQNEFDNQYLVMDMYPVVRISDNVAGLYDVITETFFSSPVGNDFIVGPDLYADTRINVKYNDGLDVNSNNELINTGVLDVSLNQSDSSILDVEFADETKHIQLPSGGSSADIVAGEGILVSHNVDSVDLPIYVESFVDGDIDTTTGVPIAAPNHNILRINDFFIRIDSNRTSATVNIYDTNHTALVWKLFFYQADGTFISVSGVNWSQNDDIITIPNNTKWIKITTKYSDDGIVETSDIGTCVIKLIGSIVDVISMQKATDELLGGVRVGDYLVTDTTGRLSIDSNLIQRIETMEEHDISDTDALILNVVE